MKTVNIGELKNQLSAYLQYVRRGEEVVVRDRNQPVARILPFHGTASPEDEEKQLVASGAMKLPEKAPDWDTFFASPKANVEHRAAVRAAIESRGER